MTLLDVFKKYCSVFGGLSSKVGVLLSATKKCFWLAWLGGRCLVGGHDSQGREVVWELPFRAASGGIRIADDQFVSFRFACTGVLWTLCFMFLASFGSARKHRGARWWYWVQEDGSLEVVMRCQLAT